jgi:hypothetical protein
MANLWGMHLFLAQRQQQLGMMTTVIVSCYLLQLTASYLMQVLIIES